MGPDVVRMRRDVEVADQDRAVGRLAPPTKPAVDLREERQFVRKLVVLFRIRNISTGWDIEIMQLNIAGQRGGEVAAVLLAAPVLLRGPSERYAGQDGDPVIGLLPVQ